MARYHGPDPDHHRPALGPAAQHAPDLRHPRRRVPRRGLERRRREASGLVSEPRRASRRHRSGARRPVCRTGAHGHRGGEARAVAHDAGAMAALRRVPAADPARDPRSGARALLSQPAVSQADWSGRRLHFVGIGGAGMSGLALVAQVLGARVSGSDRAESAYTQRLRQHGIEPTIGHAGANVPPGAEVVYSTAVPADNPERAVAQRQLHRADLLAQIAALKHCLAVTGTHGKTTTAAMAVHALRGCGLDPAYVVGGELRSTDSNAGWGAGDWIVIEADESDRSLLKLDPEIAVLTNAELDHHATYSSLSELQATLATFMARAGERAVVWDRPQLRALCPGGGVPYDVPHPQLSPQGSRFDWSGVPVRLSVPGAHNCLNAAGALTACALAGAEPAAAAAALADFRGARRRFELLGATAAGVAVYDDYAHHPTEVAAALAAGRTLRPPALGG